MPFVARYGFLLLVLVFLWMFPFEHRIARFGFLLVRKTKTSNKRQKYPNGNQAKRITVQEFDRSNISAELVLNRVGQHAGSRIMRAKKTRRQETAYDIL